MTDNGPSKKKLNKNINTFTRNKENVGVKKLYIYIHI